MTLFPLLRQGDSYLYPVLSALSQRACLQKKGGRKRGWAIWHRPVSNYKQGIAWKPGQRATRKPAGIESLQLADWSCFHPGQYSGVRIPARRKRNSEFRFFQASKMSSAILPAQAKTGTAVKCADC